MVMGILKNTGKIIKESEAARRDHAELKLLVEKISDYLNISDYHLAKAAALNLINAIDNLKNR